MKLTRPYRFKGSHLICLPGNTLERLAFRIQADRFMIMRLPLTHRLAAYARSVRLKLTIHWIANDRISVLAC